MSCLFKRRSVANDIP